MNWWWLLLVPSYALGSFPSAHLVGRVVGHDPTREGSGNPGASNVYRVAGRAAGAATLLADLAKGVIPSLVGLALGGRALGLACGIAAAAGHMFPMTRRFRGGKGVATTGGTAIVMYPLLSLVLVVGWAVLLTLTRRPSIGSLVLCVALPVGVAGRGHHWGEVAAVTAVAAVVLAKHRGNIRRLVGGREQAVPSAWGRGAD